MIQSIFLLLTILTYCYGNPHNIATFGAPNIILREQNIQQLIPQLTQWPQAKIPSRISSSGLRFDQFVRYLNVPITANTPLTATNFPVQFTAQVPNGIHFPVPVNIPAASNVVTLSSPVPRTITNFVPQSPGLVPLQIPSQTSPNFLFSLSTQLPNLLGSQYITQFAVPPKPISTNPNQSHINTPNGVGLNSPSDDQNFGQSLNPMFIEPTKAPANNNGQDFPIDNGSKFPPNNGQNFPNNNAPNFPTNNGPKFPINNGQNFDINNGQNLPTNGQNFPISNGQNFPTNNAPNFPTNNAPNFPTNNAPNFPTNNAPKFPINNGQNFPINNGPKFSLNNDQNFPNNIGQNFPTNNGPKFPINNGQNLPTNGQNFPISNGQNFPTNNAPNFPTNNAPNFPNNNGQNSPPTSIPNSVPPPKSYETPIRGSDSVPITNLYRSPAIGDSSAQPEQRQPENTRNSLVPSPKNIHTINNIPLLLPYN